VLYLLEHSLCKETDVILALLRQRCSEDTNSKLYITNLAFLRLIHFQFFAACPKELHQFGRVQLNLY
jgi:hypothetical protein